MKNIIFCTIATVLAAVILASGFSMLRSAEGMSVMMSGRGNSSKVSGTALEPFSKKEVVLPKGKSELTVEMLNSIIIDGNEYAFPLQLGDHSGDLDYFIISEYDPDEEKAGNGILTIMYKEHSIATGCFYRDNGKPDGIIIVDYINFKCETNQYLPQITVAGIDVNNADIRDINRVYGYDSDEYGYSTFRLMSKDGKYRIVLKISDGNIRSIRYIDNDNTSVSDKYDNEIMIYSDDIHLPKDYSIENDTVNSGMEYIPLPEKNEEFVAFLNEAEDFQFPCTLNAFMSRLDDEAYFSFSDSKYYLDYENGVYRASGCVSIGDEISINTDILITPGRPIGEAQVIEISFNAKSEFIEKLDIERVNPYGFAHTENDKRRYYLTDYKYNNVVIDGKKVTISYWGENMEESQVR